MTEVRPESDEPGEEQAEPGVLAEHVHMALTAGEQVVDADHVVAPVEEPGAEGETDEAGAAGHDDPHGRPTAT